MPKIAIVICLYNQSFYTKLCLSSLIKNTKLPYKVFLVNNASSDDTKNFIDEMERQYPDKIVALHSETNLGFAGGNDIALKQIQNNSEFSHVFLLNNDTILPVRWAENLIRVLDSDSTVGISVPVTNYAGNRQCIKNLKINPSTFEQFAEKWEMAKANHNRSYPIGMAIGFAMLIKRECFDKVGLLDERFNPGGFEDNDYCLRVAKEGYSIYVAHDCFIYHFGSKTMNDKNVISDSKKLFETNKKRFYDKWAKINKIGEHKKIVGILRVKNGGDVLKETLSAQSRLCDEIVVFDDHSTDNTEEICKSFSKVVDYYKSEYNDFNEARDRNHVLQMAKKRNPDWIFCIDHDEIPEESLIRDIQKIVNNPNPEKKLYCFQICHLWDTSNELYPDAKDGKYFRQDGLWGTFTQGRLFKNEPNQEIRGDDEGYHCGSHPFFPIENIQTTHYRIKHYGNIDPIQRLKKYMWYTRTDKNKDKGAILGGWFNWYKELYSHIEKDKPENHGKELGEYQFKDSDYYRHIVNENSLVLTEWKENIKLSASIIVKKDDYKYLHKCIDSIKNICDEIVVVCTDEEDTDYIGIKAPSFENIFGKGIDGKIHLYGHKWRDSFSEARNFALSKCTGDWILRIDADEELQEHAQVPLMRIISNDEADVILFPIINYQKPNKDGKQSYVMSKTARVFKNISGIKYKCRVHEEINDSIDEISKSRQIRIQDNFPIPLLHYGYLKDDNDLNSKYDYYNNLMHLDIKENPNKPEPCFNLAVDCYHRDDLDNAEMYYWKAIELYKKKKEDMGGDKVFNTNIVALSDLGVVLYKKALLKCENELKESLSYLNMAESEVNKSYDKTLKNKICTHKKYIETMLSHIEPKTRRGEKKNGND